MDEMEKALREELEKHLDTLRRNLEVVPMDVLKTKYKKPYQELKESICKAATAYTRHVSLGGISRNTANSIAVFFAPNQRPRARYRTTTSRYIQIRANRFGALKVADAKTTTSKSFIRGSSSKKRMCLISLLIRSPLFESVFSATVFQEMLQPHIPPQWRQDPQRTLAR